MGGRAAEQVIYGTDEISAGAYADIVNATGIAEEMVFDYGMSETIGPMRLRLRKGTYLYSGYEYLCSEELRSKAEHEMGLILKDAFQYVLDKLEKNPELIKSLAEEVCRKENMSGREFMEAYHALQTEGI